MSYYTLSDRTITVPITIHMPPTVVRSRWQIFLGLIRGRVDVAPGVVITNCLFIGALTDGRWALFKAFLRGRIILAPSPTIEIKEKK